MSQATLLLVEDDPGLRSQLRWCFEGFEVFTAEDRDSAIAQLRRHEPQVVTLDLGLPPDPGGASEGLATLETIMSLAPQTKVIVITGNSDRENAVKAIGLGAYDFYQKPVEADLLNLIVQRAYRLWELEEENARLSQQHSIEPLPGLLTASPEMLKITRTVEKIAPTHATVLLLGESGTGKEILARALHALSPRAKQRFGAINCAAIPENLLESELFGYEKGAFTGATKQTIGRIEHAEGGTLFLDEIGDLPMSLQAKLLRFLQERVIERLGGRSEIAVDVRVIGATHQNLHEQMQNGQFREDLYYRLSEISLSIPPLRDRAGDATLLARSFANRAAKAQGKLPPAFSKDALNAIAAYPWPGNVRELENRIRRAVIMAEGPRLNDVDLELDTSTATDTHAEPVFNLRQVRDNAEAIALRRALHWVDGNMTKAAEFLGVSRPTLYDLLKKHGLNKS